MITTTIQEAWIRNIDVTGHEVYLYRHGETVLYVGHSWVPLDRLRAHLTPSNSSSIGKYIRDNFPDSLQWTMELFNHAECEVIVKEHLPDEYYRYKKNNQGINWVSFAERTLIKVHKPPYNTINNPNKIKVSKFYLSATQAARELGVNEKTVRRWIDKGELEAMHATKNRYAIPTSEVARIAEDKIHTNPIQESIQQRIDALEELVREIEALAMHPVEPLEHPEQDERLNVLLQRIEAIETRLNAIEEQLEGSSIHKVVTPPKPEYKLSTTDDIPPGSLLMREFAKRHKPPSRDWYQLRIDRGEIEAIAVPYHGKPQYWFSAEQQAAVLAYVRGKGIQVGQCDDPSCPCHEK